MNGCQRKSGSQDIPGVNVVSAPIVRGYEEGPGRAQPQGNAFHRGVAVRIRWLRQCNPRPQEWQCVRGLVGQPAVARVSMGDEASDARVESGEDLGEQGVGDGGGIGSGLGVALGVQGGGLRGSQVIAVLGDVDAVAEDGARGKRGRGRGELGEDTADFARSVDEHVVGPLERNGVAEGRQAQGQRVAHGERARVHEPAEHLGGE